MLKFYIKFYTYERVRIYWRDQWFCCLYLAPTKPIFMSLLKRFSVEDEKEQKVNNASAAGDRVHILNSTDFLHNEAKPEGFTCAKTHIRQLIKKQKPSDDIIVCYTVHRLLRLIPNFVFSFSDKSS